jgi:hypothetical protein
MSNNHNSVMVHNPTSGLYRSTTTTVAVASHLGIFLGIKSEQQDAVLLVQASLSRLVVCSGERRIG